MTDADRPRFAELMLALSETFESQVSSLRMQLYFDSLRDLPIESVTSAVQAAIDRLKFFPKPVELREMVDGPVADAAALAWAEFTREVGRVGYMRTPSLPATTMETVRIVFGGWRQACGSLPAPDSERAPELMGWRKQFIAAYGDTTRREAIQALTTGEAKNAIADITAYRQKQFRGESA